jgi:hypothetical protein
MSFVQKGTVVLFKEHHAYAGDTYQCLGCDEIIINATGNSYYLKEEARGKLSQKGFLFRMEAGS